jgi:hypothetical protein
LKITPSPIKAQFVLSRLFGESFIEQTFQGSAARTPIASIFGCESGVFNAAAALVPGNRCGGAGAEIGKLRERKP